MAEMKARILILAVSAQSGNYCVAGKSLGDKRWIRPITGNSGDGIPRARLALAGGEMATVGDIVEMALSDHTPESNHQTENRIVAGNSSWEKIKRVGYSDLGEYADNVSDGLWANGENTRNGENNCISNPTAGGSLRFFRVQDMEVKRMNDGLHQEKPRPYAIFRINNINYKMRVTDCRNSSPWERGDCHIPDCFVCVSLTQKFSVDERCHKLVACIIDPERLP